MDNDGNKVTWTVIIISAIAIIGLMFVNFMPSQTSNIKTTISNELSSFVNSNKSDSSSSKSSSSSSKSSSHTTVKPNLLINTSSSATNGQTTMQGAAASVGGVNKYSRTDSYEQVTANSNSGEFFYRFVSPYTNSLHGLTPGETYTLSGSASHTAGKLDFRAEYLTTGRGYLKLGDPSDLGIPVSDGSAFTPFSYTFTIPVKATDVYFSLQNYNYTNGSLFRFKNMKLVKD